MKNYLKIGAIAFVLTMVNLQGFYKESIAKPQVNPIVQSKKCEDLPTIIEQKECYEKGYYQANQKLNQAYTKLKSVLQNDTLRGKEGQKALLDSQQSWLKFRDSNCYFRSSGWGGTTRVAFQLSCLERMTKERTLELEELSKN